MYKIGYTVLQKKYVVRLDLIVGNYQKGTYIWFCQIKNK